MSCLNFNGTNRVVFTPISSALANLPNGAGTMVALCRHSGFNQDICGLINSAASAWYHGISFDATGGGAEFLYDDDGIVGCSTITNAVADQTSGAGNYSIVSVDWPSGGAALERMHSSSLMSAAESWNHFNSAANNGGNRAGPGTSGHFNLGSFFSAGGLTGDIALVAVWAGTRFTDTDVTNLWVNKKTSDWWNHPAGQPTTLIECNVAPASLVDIGANPSTYNTNNSVAQTAPDPTGWTFDGHGVATQTVLPDADTTTTGWTTTPLWSKVNDSSDSTVIQATLS